MSPHWERWRGDVGDDLNDNFSLNVFRISEFKYISSGVGHLSCLIPEIYKKKLDNYEYN